MTGQDVRETEHRITVKAPAQIVYRLLAEVPDWPLIFPPTVYAHRIEGTDREERIQIWATANGEAKAFVSWRNRPPGPKRSRHGLMTARCASTENHLIGRLETTLASLSTLPAR